MQFKLNAIGVASLVLVAAHSAALAEQANFKTPSGNIFCGYFDYEGPPEVRCDIREFTSTMGRRPADCDLDWGDAFVVNAQSNRGEAMCHGDTVMSPDAKVLGYGRSFAAGGLTCASDSHGLTCINGKGHGFFVSKAKQRVF